MRNHTGISTPIESAAHAHRAATGGRFGLGWFGAMILAVLVGCSLQLPKAQALQKFSFPAAQFPGPANFIGDAVLQPRPAKDGLQSTYSGTIFVSMRDRTEVEKVLPAGFHLANQTSASTTHPVIFLLGDQRELSTLAGGTAIPLCQGCGYQEMILLIPFVVRQGQAHWHNYAARMFLDDIAAVAGGNAIYGYAKEVATLTRVTNQDSSYYEISPWFDGVVFQAELGRTGPWTPADQSPASAPRWAELKTVFQAPVLGQQPKDSPTPLAVICSYWEWDYTIARVAPAYARHRIVKKLRSGMENWVSPAPMASPDQGAISVRGIRWRLATPPEGCQSD
jgi:hypothetical protein